MKESMSKEIKNLPRTDGHHLAFMQRPSRKTGPGLVFLPGFRSDMSGTKADALDDLAARHGIGLTRFDYFAHGQSSGSFVDGTIGQWLEDIMAVLDQLTYGPQILIGSSMGGWLALLAALARPERISALLLIAPAADFTQKLMWPNLPKHIRDQIMTNGSYAMPSGYSDEPLIFTRQLIEEGRTHLIMDQPINLHCPIRILQGMKDPDVPWDHALALSQVLVTDDVTLTLIKDGDHRLSRPSDLKLLERSVLDLISAVS